jgi:hypothetical protein
MCLVRRVRSAGHFLVANRGFIVATRSLPAASARPETVSARLVVADSCARLGEAGPCGRRRIRSIKKLAGAAVVKPSPRFEGYGIVGTTTEFNSEKFAPPG